METFLFDHTYCSEIESTGRQLALIVNKSEIKVTVFQKSLSDSPCNFSIWGESIV